MAMATANQRNLSTTLLTEHLRYTPLTLLDDIINTVNELVARAVDAAEEGLLAADPAALGFSALPRDGEAEKDREARVKEEVRAEVEEGCHRLETLLESSVDRNFDKLEIYLLRSVLSVPADLVPWVRLGHYEGLKFPTTVEGVVTGREGEKNLEGIQRLRRKVQETRRLRTALKRQVEKNEVLLRQLRRLILPPVLNPDPLDSSNTSERHPPATYAFLTTTPSAQTLGISPISATAQPKSDTATPLSTNTSFTLSQLPSLRALLAELRPHIPSPSDSLAPAAESAASKERRLYLETQTRRVLERRGIAIGEDGDGGAADGGRRVDGEEVRALEGIVELLPR